MAGVDQCASHTRLTDAFHLLSSVDIERCSEKRVMSGEAVTSIPLLDAASTPRRTRTRKRETTCDQSNAAPSESSSKRVKTDAELQYVSATEPMATVTEEPSVKMQVGDDVVATKPMKVSCLATAGAPSNSDCAHFMHPCVLSVFHVQPGVIQFS